MGAGAHPARGVAAQARCRASTRDTISGVTTVTRLGDPLLAGAVRRRAPSSVARLLVAPATMIVILAVALLVTDDAAVGPISPSPYRAATQCRGTRREGARAVGPDGRRAVPGPGHVQRTSHRTRAGAHARRSPGSVRIPRPWRRCRLCSSSGAFVASRWRSADMAVVARGGFSLLRSSWSCLACRRGRLRRRVRALPPDPLSGR